MTEVTKTELTNALMTIANFFDEKETNSEGVEVNQLGYIQGRILNGICYGAAQTLQRSNHSKAVYAVKSAAESHRGDAISEDKLQRAINWAKKIELQDLIVEEFLIVAEKVHEDATGQRFQMGTRSFNAAEHPQTDAMKEAAAMIGKVLNPSTEYASGLQSTEKQYGLRTSAYIPRKVA